jgi:DNA repair exonuclease SbcCD nuclease subunit
MKKGTSIIILGDCHFGARNDSEVFNEYFFKFYEKFLFPFIEENSIKHVIQTGDFMDKRKGVNYRTLNSVTGRFMLPLRDLGCTFYGIPGNHDIFHRHSNDINSLTELFSWMDHVNIYTSPSTITIDGCDIDMIPWMNKYNTQDILNFIKNSTSQYCVGHFEIEGFDMSIGIPGHGGLNLDIFESYDEVWSGHYHTRSKRRNITYVGTPYEITWSDYNDPKGFHVFDTSTRELTFHENPFRMFHKAFYSSDVDYDELDFDELRDGIVKIIVSDHKDSEKYDDFISRIEAARPSTFSIVESDSVVVHGVSEEDIDEMDTFTILRSNAAKIAEEEGLSPEIMLKYINELYSEAIAIGRDQ